MIGPCCLVAEETPQGKKGGDGGCKSMELCVRIPAFLFKGIGDMNLAHQCFRLALVNNNNHAEAYNNLAVLEMRKGHVEQVSELLWFRG